MNKTFEVSITCAGQYPLKFSAVSLILPTGGGFVGVMANRRPMLAALDAGVITLRLNNGETKYFGVTGGFAEVVSNRVSLLCDFLLTLDDAYSQDFSDKPFYFENTKNMNETQKREYITRQIHRKRYLSK